MLIERFEDRDLSQFSYAVGCERSGVLAVIDPRRDVDVYTDFASRRGLSITHVLETHIHADFASGARELAAVSGAELMLSAYDAGERYGSSFPHRELTDGQRIDVGEVALEVVHTPGHTPEHVSFLVLEGAAGNGGGSPRAMLSGDFLFVGSLGRPDLLGEEEKLRLAGLLYRSVRERLPGLPDELEILPGHGAGSMCGAGMSGRPSSTLGAERLSNPYLDPQLGEAEFVDRILGSSPFFPPYYRRMKVVNSAGPPLLDGLPGQRPLPVDDFAALVDDGAVVVDVRRQEAFAAGHVPGSFSIAARRGLSTWGAWTLPYERPLLLVADDPATVEAAARSLVRVGLDDVRGFLEGGVESWVGSGRPVARTDTVDPLALRSGLDDGVRLLDVRTAAEYRRCHVPGSIHIMGGEVAERLDELPGRDEPLAVICGSGFRSMVVASQLQREGFGKVMNVSGGIAAWMRAGLPVEEGA